MNIALWVIQALLALVFLASGLMKVGRPIEQIRAQTAVAERLSVPVIRGIGVLELLGAIGIVVPLLTGILPWLTPVAAIGLVLTMVGAIIAHVIVDGKVNVQPILLLMALFVVFGRWGVLVAGA